MNEKSDEPAKQSAEPDQSSAQDQPRYREVSQEELNQILAAHQKWLESDKKEGKQADLNEVDLHKFNLGDANLQGADLWKANLGGANLWQANLQGAYLGFANLQKADLDEANVQEVNLGFANLQGADLWETNLQEADLQKAEGVTASQIKRARNWELAFYSDSFLKELGLPADHNETVKKKLAEMEKEKEKTATKP